MRFLTPLKFYNRLNQYVVGHEDAISWGEIKEANGASVYYANWSSTYGAVKAASLTSGIMDTATVTLPFAPVLYEALQNRTVVIAKNCSSILNVDGEIDPGNPNAWELYSGVENVNEAGRTMKFIVRRYTAK